MPATCMQFNPSLALETADGQPGYVHAMLDYGPEHDTLFLFMNSVTRQIWWLPNSRLRVADNISLGRLPVTNA